MPAALDRPCGTLARKKPAITPMPSAPPAITDSPTKSDSGMPSSTDPMAMAVPLPRCCSSLGCATHSPQRFLCFAPIRERYQLTPLNIAAPASSAVMADRPFSKRNEPLISPPTTKASWTPAPKPITTAIVRCLSLLENISAAIAPTRSPLPDTRPHNPTTIASVMAAYELRHRQSRYATRPPACYVRGSDLRFRSVACADRPTANRSVPRAG